jgi:hypothetical protein
MIFPWRQAFCRCETIHSPAQEPARLMKVKTKHRKSYKWRKSCDSSPVAKGRRPKIQGKRNPRKAKHAGGRGL